MTQQLVAIAAPLTQSWYEKMACPYSYVVERIEGRHTADTAPSWRGTEVHHVMAQYTMHCSNAGVPADWAAFDRIAATVGTEAGRICDGLRDWYLVDHAHILGAELTLRLTEAFQPTLHSGNAAYQGTLDALRLVDDRTAIIDDFKSHPRPFDADTMQALLYPALVFQGYPDIQTVTFRLIFVRYKNLIREVTWTRADLPKMLDELFRARARQLSYHATYAQEGAAALPVLPHAGCHYCSLLQMGDCPVADVNPHAADPVELVRELQFMRKRQAHVVSILKDALQAKGDPIVATDANGTELYYGSSSRESLGYPANALMDGLRQWSVATGDQDFLNGLRISSTTIKSKLNTKKRAVLREQVEGKLVKTTKVKTELQARDIGLASDEDEEF